MDNFGSPTPEVGRGEPADGQAAHRGNRSWWTRSAHEYYAEHGAFLGDTELVWGPEGVTETQLGLLGDVRGKDLLEFGAGAAQGSRWVVTHGGRCVATDIAEGMLSVGREIDARVSTRLEYVQADAAALPFADNSFDIVFSAYGGTPFVADLPLMLRECARVLRPGGRLVYSTSHPIRWAFPDAPDALEATMSYFERTPYVERVGERVQYAEYHRTLGDHVRALHAAGLHLEDLIEPEWPEWNDQVWGGWSPLRGQHIPGTSIFAATLLRE